MAYLVKEGYILTTGFIRDSDKALIKAEDITIKSLELKPTILDEIEVAKAIGKAVSASRVELLTTTDINNIKTNYDAYIKANATISHSDGDVVEIKYTGTNSKYLAPPVVGVYSRFAGNYILTSDNAKNRDEFATIKSDLTSGLATKANDNAVIKIDNSRAITGLGPVALGNNSENNPFKIPRRSEVSDMGKAIEAQLTAYKAVVAQEQTTQNNRLVALEATTIDKFVKGKWELKAANIAPTGSPAANATTATFNIPVVDDSNTTITRTTGDIITFAISGTSTSLGPFRQTFPIEYGATNKDVIIAAENVETIYGKFANNTLTTSRTSGTDVDFSSLRIELVEQELFAAKTNLATQSDLLPLALKTEVAPKQNKLIAGSAVRGNSNVEAILRQLDHDLSQTEGKAFKKADGTFTSLSTFAQAIANPTNGDEIGATIAWTEDQLDERANKALSNISGTQANKRYVITTNAQNIPSIHEEATPSFNPIKYYKGQILIFHEVKTGTQFENTSKFEKHTTYQDETLLGGTDKTRQSGTIKSHYHTIYIRPDSSPGGQVRGTSESQGGYDTHTSSVGGNRNLAAGIRVMAVIYIAKRDIRENEM